MIDMDTFGNYTIQEWVDPSLQYDIDGMIFELFHNKDGHLELVHWTVDDLLEMFTEMKNFWGSSEYWDQVMVGYTDLSTEALLKHYSNAELNKDACDVMADHLTQAAPD